MTICPMAHHSSDNEVQKRHFGAKAPLLSTLKPLHVYLFIFYYLEGCESEKNKLSDHFYELPKNISGAMKIDDQDFRRNLKINVEDFGNFFTRNGKNECYSA